MEEQTDNKIPTVRILILDSDKQESRWRNLFEEVRNDLKGRRFILDMYWVLHRIGDASITLFYMGGLFA